MRIMLLRVGIDMGCGGSLAPIFPDGAFEYIPIPESRGVTDDAPRYCDLPARRGGMLSDYVAKRHRDRPVHLDPEFVTYTYGDPTRNKRGQLLRLNPGDILTFYSGLRPVGWRRGGGLFIIGYFTVKEAFEVENPGALTQEELRCIGDNAHFKRLEPDPRLVVVKGDPGRSRLLERAARISDERGQVEETLIPFLGYSGSLVRAVGRWIPEERVSHVGKWLEERP